MKKLTLMLLVIFNFVVICQGQQIQEIVNAMAKDTCLHYVDTLDRKRFLENYKNTYRSIDSSVHTGYIDFPVSYIKFMYKFFDTNKEYDGLRVNMANFYRNPINRNKRQIMLMFSPTINKKADSTAFKNFRKQKIEKQEFRKINTYPIYAGKKKKNKHFLTHGAHKFNKYKSAYRKNYLNSCLYTTSLFICRHNIELLQDLFNGHPEYDKIRFEFISYNEMRVDKQCSPFQISLLLTPVQKGVPDPRILKDYVLKAMNGKINDIRILSVNHGELCPFKCN